MLFFNSVMARSIQSVPIPLGYLFGICLLRFQNCGDCPRWGQLKRTNAPRWDFWESANDQPVKQENNKHSRTNVFYRICNSSNRFLAANTGTFSCTVYALLVISCLQNNICTSWSGTKCYFKVRKTKLFLTMPHPPADLLWQMPHHEEGEDKCWGGDGRLELIKPLLLFVTNIASMYTLLDPDFPVRENQTMISNIKRWNSHTWMICAALALMICAFCVPPCIVLCS